jgi:hypothetical protein
MNGRFWRQATYGVATAVLLAGCGSAALPSQKASALVSQVSLPAERTGSWMLPEASGEDLLYVSNYYTVLVFSYPQRKLVGTLKGFHDAAGECVDSKGDVFISNFPPEVVYEYAHGGTKRIGTYPGKKAGSIGCAINPVNGDLAITGVSSYVDIYKGAEGKPVSIQDKGMWYGSLATYDDKGDLFFLGLQNPKGKTRLSELAKGSNSFVGITLDAPIYSEGGIQWANNSLTTVSWVPFKGQNRTTAIFQFQVTGTKAHKTGASLLNEPADIVLQYFIDGTTLVAPNLEGDGTSNVLLYNYPSGGNPTSILTKHVSTARGAVVSPAPLSPALVISESPR